MDQDGRRFIRVKGVRWYTNLDFKQRHEDLILVRKYTPDAYLNYDNYDGINVDSTADIPCDYSGMMGVPITFLDKYNPDQFEILGVTQSWCGVASKIYPKQTAMAQKVPQTINNYYGTVVNGNIKQSQVVSGDHNSLSFNYEQASDLIRQIKEAIQDEQMSEEDREIAEELISESESKIAAQAKPGVIRATLSGLKDFLIGAGANIAGALIVQYLQ